MEAPRVEPVPGFELRTMAGSASDEKYGCTGPGNGSKRITVASLPGVATSMVRTALLENSVARSTSSNPSEHTWRSSMERHASDMSQARQFKLTHGTLPALVRSRRATA